MGAIVEELQRHLYVAFPTIIRFLFFVLSDCLYVALVGHYDSTQVSHFAGATMGMMLVNVTGLSLGVGFAGAIGPFVSQDYGKGCTKRSGLHLFNFVRCAAIIFLFALLASNVSELIFVAMGQDPEVAANVQSYARIAVWALPGQILIKALQQVLDAQRDVVPGLVTDVIGALLQVPLCWVVLRSGCGFAGAAYVKVLVNTLMCVFLVAWIHCSGRGMHVWFLPADEPPAPMLQFLKQAVPNTFATCIEWWAQEFMALLAGLLPHPGLTVASHGILFNCAVVFYTVWIGSKNAMATRVGNLIGSGRCRDVPRAVAVGLGLCSLEILLVIMLGWHYRLQIVSIFTANSELQYMVLQTWRTMLLVLAPYAFTFVIFGVLSGAGQQEIVAYVFLASLVIGMPIGVYLTFSLHYGLDGLWIGNGAFLGISGCVLCGKVMQVDWPSKQMLEQHFITIDDDPSVGA